MTRKTAITAMTLLALATTANAQRPKPYTPSPVQGSAWNAHGNLNPFIPGYFADPTIRKFGDTYYIYATTDGTGNGYGPAQVWMSYDFVNWRNVVMNWPTTEVVWAPDVVQQPNGKYRYYYCEPCNINIGESDSPTGPWTNILGKEDAVMVPDRYIHNVITLDPMLFEDDDKQQYLYFTTWGIYEGFGCGVAKLNDGEFSINDLPKDMRADARRWNENHPFPIAADKFFTEKRLIPNTELKDVFEAPFIFKKDGIYYFTYSSGSCHDDTYRVQYAISKTGPMGPYEYKGCILNTNADETIHGPGHHSILVENGEYYIVYHRHNNPKSIHGFNRQVCIDKMEFDANGDIKPVIPTHNGLNPLVQNLKPSKAKKAKGAGVNLAAGAKVTASSYYDEWFKPEYATDENNGTLWRGKNVNGKEWIQVDLGSVKTFNEVWTLFEYPTFFYQYQIETSSDGNKWEMYADRQFNSMQGSPMIDSKKVKARYVRLTILNTQKNGHFPAVWEIKVWDKAPKLPPLPAATNDSYPGMHTLDVPATTGSFPTTIIDITADYYAADMARDITTIKNNSGLGDLRSQKPLHTTIKEGKWGFFFNGNQSASTDFELPAHMKYNAPYTIEAWLYNIDVNGVETILCTSKSRSDLATTEFRLGTDPQGGLVAHNGSFENSGNPRAVRDGEGKWQHWVVTFDGYMEKIYLNGKLLQQKNNFIMVRPQGNITIGAAADGGNCFKGYIHSLKLLSTSVSAEEVESMYKAPSDAKSPLKVADDFEEIDPDSKFVLNPQFKLAVNTPEMTLSADNGDFNNDPFSNGGRQLAEATGDFVIMAKVEDMEGLSACKVTGYNECGIMVQADGVTYHLGAFPLYNCGNMLTILSSRGRPQHQNYKGYDFDRYLQIERKGDMLYARTSKDGVTWSNMSGSPIEIDVQTMKLGVYQTTYNNNKSWGKLTDIKVWK